MNGSDPFLALLGTVVIFTAVLCFCSCIPWCLAAELYKTMIAPTHVKAIAVRATALAAFLIWITLLFHPDLVRLSSPLADAIARLLADPCLSELPPRWTTILRALLLAEFMMIFAFPVLLVVVLLAIALHFIVLAPPVSWFTWLLNQIVGAIIIRSTRRREARAQRHRRVMASRTERERRQGEQARLRTSEEQKREHLRQTVHRLVQSFDELPMLPDSRRATLAAQDARQLPAEHRQEIFALYRDHIITHAAHQLERDTDADQLLRSVTELLSALDIPGVDHEARYILSEAQQRIPSPLDRFARDFRRQVTELQQRHRIRSQTIRDANLHDPDLVDRLLDVEDTILKNALLGLALPDDDPLPQLDIPFHAEHLPPTPSQDSLDDNDE